MSRWKRISARLAATATVLFALGLACLGMISPRGSSASTARAAQMISAPVGPTPTVPTPVPTTMPAHVSLIQAASEGQHDQSHGKHHNHNPRGAQ